MRQAARAPTVYKFENRVRKADETKKCILSQWQKIQGCAVMPPHLTGASSRLWDARAGRPRNFLNDFLNFPLDIFLYLYYNKDNKRIKKGNDDK